MAKICIDADFVACGKCVTLIFNDGIEEINPEIVNFRREGYFEQYVKFINSITEGLREDEGEALYELFQTQYAIDNDDDEWDLWDIIDIDMRVWDEDNVIITLGIANNRTELLINCLSGGCVYEKKDS